MSIKVNHNINLLTSNSKADKTNNLLSQFVVKFLQLAPANEADKYQNICKYSTKTCRSVCIYRNGNGRYPNVINSRTNKTLFYLNDNGLFMEKWVATELYPDDEGPIIPINWMGNVE